MVGKSVIKGRAELGGVGLQQTSIPPFKIQNKKQTFKLVAPIYEHLVCKMQITALK